MRVLIAGATSDTGRRLAERLLEQGHEVVCYARHEKGLPGGVRTVIGALPALGQAWGQDGEAFDEAAAGCPLAYCITHIRFAPAMVEHARAAGVVRTVCVSSARRFTNWIDEPARAVIAAEAELERDPEGWTALRSTMIYGGGRDKNISRLVRLVRRWPVIPLPGGGRNRIQPIHCDDLVAALLAAGRAKGVGGKIIDVAGPEPMEYRAVIRAIAAALRVRRLLLPIPLAPARLLAGLGGKALRGRVLRMGDDRTLDISEARALLGLDPRPFAEGLSQWLRECDAGIDH